MPAIQPALLKTQIAQIITYFDRPADFLRALVDMLEFYADRTLRPGGSGSPPPLIDAYHVPRQVMRQIQRELASKVAGNSSAALELADALWTQPWLEIRLLAIYLVGEVPPEPPERVLERVRSWEASCSEGRLVEALLDKGIARLRQESQPEYLSLLEDWIHASSLSTQQLALRAMRPLVSESEFDNLPLLFRWIAPLARESGAELGPDLIDVLRTLGERSPQETAYFLRQNLGASSSPEMAYLVRQVLPSLPKEMAADLRTTLRSEEGSPG
jgi:hypothetical protein